MRHEAWGMRHEVKSSLDSILKNWFLSFPSIHPSMAIFLRFALALFLFQFYIVRLTVLLCAMCCELSFIFCIFQFWMFVLLLSSSLWWLLTLSCILFTVFACIQFVDDFFFISPICFWCKQQTVNVANVQHSSFSLWQINNEISEKR